ncbi:MAG: PD-(D/E)XK nuclease family protein [Candidatus Krumholzibacteriota bacterium]|nr:PD-(D/E)XK nuclease family protein [Candidatus Krumholzibacteriota bacterium]
MNATVITAESYSRLRVLLKEEIERRSKSDKFSPINILVRSNLVAGQLQLFLSRRLGGIFNVRFMTFPDLLTNIENLSGIYSSGKLPAGSERILLEEIVSSGSVPDYFNAIADTEGFIDFLIGTFSDLSESGCTAGIASEIINEKGGGLPERVLGVLSLYTTFRKRVLALGLDVHARFERACGLAGNVKLNGPLYTYGFYDFNEMQLRLLMEAAVRGKVCLFVPAGEGGRYRFAAKTLKRLKKRGAELSSSGSDDGSKESSTLLLEASDEETEAAAIVRLILKKIRRDKIPFRDIAVIYPSGGNFAPLKEVLEDALIPLEPPIERSRVFRAANLLLDLLSGPVKRKRMVEFLISAPLEVPAGLESESDPFSLWVKKSAEFGLTGEDGWVEGNGNLIDFLSRGEESPDTKEAVLSAKITGDILKRIMDVRKTFEEENGWPGMSSLLSVLFRDIFKDDKEVDQLCIAVEGLSRLDRVSDSVSFSLLAKTVKSLLRGPGEPRGKLSGEGINLLTLDQARGLSFKTVFLAGLNDENIPGVIRQDPFLKDTERAKLNEAAGGKIFLQKKTGRLAELELIFTLAVQSAASELICSAPLSDASSGNKRIKSFFLESFERSLDVSGKCGVEKKKVFRKQMPERVDELLSIDEFDYSRALSFRESGGGNIPPGDFFARSIEMLKNRRNESRFTPFDGVFESRAARACVRSMLERKGYLFSATSLERYAKCPFSFLMNNVLQVESLEEPETIIGINPMQRGFIVHELLERFYRNLAEKDLLPVKRDKWELIWKVFKETADKIFGWYSRNRPVGLELLWEMEKGKIERSVNIFLEKELDEKGEYTPVLFEKPFSLSPDDIELILPGNKRKVGFRGRIDRIDFMGNESFRVIDYKTGSLEGKKNNTLRGGDYLQLPVYLLGASSISGRPLETGIAEYRAVNTKGKKSAVRFDGERLAEMKTEFEEILDTIVSGIEKGLFFAVPSKDNCKYCSAASVCPAGKESIFKRKAGFDGRCRDYLEMKGLIQGKK